MTTNEVKGLPAKWRNAADASEADDARDGEPGMSPSARCMLRDCADELESALASAPAGEAVFTEKHCLDLRGIKVGEVLTVEQWEAVCAFVREQDAIIDSMPTPAADASEGEDDPEHEGDTCRSNDLYAGNSVGWWKSKADNYRDDLLKVYRALGSIGVKMDGNTPCWEYVARLATSAQPGDAGMVDYHTLRCWLLGIGVVGKIDGHDVIRRDSMVDMLTRWLASAPPQPNRASIAPEVAQSERPASGERPTKPAECANGCPPMQVCDYCRHTYTAAPVQADGREVDEAAALAEFTEYFVRNYPGPNTIICDPNWHAPRIFRAAKRAIAQQAHGDSNG